MKNLIFNIAGITAIATFIYILFMIGYFNYFNINENLIFLNNPYGFFNIALIVIIISIPIIIPYLIIEGFYIENQDKKHKLSKFDKMLKNFGKNHKIISVIVGIIVVFVSVIAMDYIYYEMIYQSMDIKVDFLYILIVTLIEAFMVILYIFLKKSTSKKAAIYFIFMIFICLMYSIITDNGRNYAENKKSFILVDKYIVLYNSNNSAIGCKYKEYIEDNQIKVIIDTSELIKFDIKDKILKNKIYDEVKLGSGGEKQT